MMKRFSILSLCYIYIHGLTTAYAVLLDDCIYACLSLQFLLIYFSIYLFLGLELEISHFDLGWVSGMIR